MAGQRTWYAVSKLRRTGVCHHLATVILLSLRLRFQVGKWHLGMSSWSYTPTYRGERPPPVTISTPRWRAIIDVPCSTYTLHGGDACRFREPLWLLQRSHRLLVALSSRTDA
jgi:hypothetical protein|eukprot:COSAG01_NODE_3409_length_6127_cov_19.096384_6_plen_112_part_00